MCDYTQRRCLLCKRTIDSDTYYRPVVEFFLFRGRDYHNCCVDCWDMDEVLFEEKFEESFLLEFDENPMEFYDRVDLDGEAALGEVGVRSLFDLKTEETLVKPAKTTSLQ